MEFESLINHIEGVRDQVSGKLGSSKLDESRFQESIDTRCHTLALNMWSYTYCVNLHAEGA